MRFAYSHALVAAGIAALLLGPAQLQAQVAPAMGQAGSFAVLGASTVTNTGSSVINGDVGVSPGTAVTGFPPGSVVGGTIHLNDAVAMQAQSDVTTAYDALTGQACDDDLTGQDLGGETLTPGVYCFSTEAQLTGVLTLDFLGDSNAVFIFKIGTAITTASSASVEVINAGTVCNVFWQVGSSATLGSTTSFVGSILALESITMVTGATLDGRALARTGAVTMDTNDIDVSMCQLAEATPTETPTETPTGTPTGTPTVTPTQTPTETPTDTPVATPTDTPVATPTDTPVATPTDTPVATPTDTPVATPTDTPVATPTDTPPATPTDTPTDTPTETPTALGANTGTPTQTPTSSPSETPTETPTQTPTLTPTATATGTATPTPTATATETVLPVATASATPRATPVPVPLINSPTSASGVAMIGLLLLVMIASMRRNGSRREV